MKSEHNQAASTGQIETSTGLTLVDALFFFVPLLILLAVLGWVTWEIRSVNPMAFAVFAGLVAAEVVLAIASVWSPDLSYRHTRRAFGFIGERSSASSYPTGSKRELSTTSAGIAGRQVP